MCEKNKKKTKIDDRDDVFRILKNKTYMQRQTVQLLNQRRLFQLHLCVHLMNDWNDEIEFDDIHETSLLSLSLKIFENNETDFGGRSL